MPKITERYKTRISNLKKEIKKQDKFIKYQTKAIDKSIETNNTLRSFLEFPQEIADNATSNYHGKSTKDFTKGYKQALIDIKKALHIKSYPTLEDIDAFLFELGIGQNI